MQSFYYSSKKTKNLKNKFYDLYKTFDSGIDNKFGTLDFFYNSDNQFIYKENNKFIASLGVFLYKKQFGKNALKSFFSDLKDNSINLLLNSKEVSGGFCLIYFNGKDLSIITDKLGYYVLYAYQKNNILEISNAFLPLAQTNETTISNLGVAQYLSENIAGHACCNRNIVNEVTFLDGGMIYTVKNGHLKSSKYYDIKSDIKLGLHDDADEVANLISAQLNSNLSFVNKIDNEVIADMTGGIDTRVNIAHLVDRNIDFTPGVQLPIEYEHYTNTGRYSELNIINQIRDVLDVDMHLYGDDEYRNNKSHIDEYSLYFSNKLTYNRRAGYFSSLHKKKSGLVISGLSGTEFLRQPYLNHFNSHDKLDLSELVKDYYPILDLLDDSFLNQEEYYNEISSFISSSIDGIEFEDYRDLGSYIDYIAFYRTHFSRYFSLANSVLPFYTTYGDFSIAKILLQTSYATKQRFSIQRRILSKLNYNLAKIDSTRGFPLSTVNETNFIEFENLIDQNVPQQYIDQQTLKYENEFRKKISYYFDNKDEFYKKYGQSIKSEKLNLLHSPTDFSIISSMDKVLSLDLPVFEFVDKEKFLLAVKNDGSFNYYNRVMNLNAMLEKIGI